MSSEGEQVKSDKIVITNKLRGQLIPLENLSQNKVLKANLCPSSIFFKKINISYKFFIDKTLAGVKCKLGILKYHLILRNSTHQQNPYQVVTFKCVNILFVHIYEKGRFHKHITFAILLCSLRCPITC